MYPMPVGKFTRAGTRTLLVVWAMQDLWRRIIVPFTACQKFVFSLQGNKFLSFSCSLSHNFSYFMGNFIMLVQLCFSTQSGFFPPSWRLPCHPVPYAIL